MSRLSHIISMAAVLCLAVTSLHAEEFADIQAKIVSFTLNNGLTVILYPRGDAPVVSCVTYVKVGSADEHVGITGIAHQLEHLAFKGSPFIGTKDYEHEKPALEELNKLYAQIQQFEQKLPTELRDPFLTLLAQVTSTGGGNADKIEKMFGALAESWKQAGVNLKDDERATLASLIKQFAEKVKDAEQYVVQNEYSTIIDNNGGVGLNAFTSDDRTVYHVSIPSNKLELWAALESDRFMNIVPRQLEKEKQVVLEERRWRTDSSPFGKLYETFLGVAFEAHPYGVPVIGYRSDILGYTRAKIMKFYREHYVPSRTIVAVVGNFDVEAARKMLSEYFGRIPAAPDPEPVVTVEPAQEGERRLEVEFPAQPLLFVAYHIPERNHHDTPALVVLDELATSGRASRLYANLVKTKKSNSVNSFIGPGSRFPRMIGFSAEPVEGQNADDLEANLLKELDRLKTEPPSKEELQRVLTGYRAGILRTIKSNLDFAQELADYQALAGDWHDLFRDIQKISAVTPEEVSAAAAKYLTKQNRTVGRLVTNNNN